MQIKKLFLGLAAALTTMSIVGCAEEPARTADQAANSLTGNKLNKDAQEMAQLKAKLQEEDPSVVDVLKTVDGEGKETIKIVREDKDTGDMIVAAMVGMTAGMLMSSLMQNSMNRGGYSQYDDDDRKKKKRRSIYSGATISKVNKSGYSSWKRQSRQNYISNVRKSSIKQVKSNPSKYSVGTRSQAFKGSSARSGSYSRGS